MAKERITVGIVGASGYSGGELIRLLRNHPRTDIAWMTSRQDRDFEAIHRNLLGSGLQFIREEDATPCDVVFLCMPSRQSMNRARTYLDRGSKVIDIGSDFRLKDKATFEQVYKAEHSDWELVEQAPYGATELHRTAIQQANLVANPGCFAYTTILALAPLIHHKLVDFNTIIANCLSGTSGAGAESSTATHHSEISQSTFPYNAVGHRHTYEIEQELQGISGEKVSVNFIPHYAPFTRGILASCHGFLLRKITREDILSLYRDFYDGEYFVKIITMAKDPSVGWQYLPYPSVAAVAGSNFVHIGADVDPLRKRVSVFAALDNLGKGAASSAIQNMNAMMGWPEETGISTVGLHP